MPDQNGSVVTDGRGKFGAFDYVSAARTPDGKLAMAYLPDKRTVTVDMTKLSGPAVARWYDPSRGTYTAVEGSPLPNSGEHAFTPPGNNGDGDGDWVLVLETAPPKEGERR